MGQGGTVWGGQPVLAEASAEPAARGFHQAFLGDLLQGGMQRQVQLATRHVTGNQLEHTVAAILALLADQQPVVATLPVESQAHGYAEVGQLAGKVLGGVDLQRTAPLEHLAEVQRGAERLVDQALCGGFDMQRLGLEGARVLAGENPGHGDSLG
ncbi:hypothetical protein D9M71_345280 [compost metagenome]